MKVIDPWGAANLDPRGLIGRVYIEEHFTLLHTKYIGCGPHVSEKIFLSFLINYKSKSTHVAMAT